MTNEQAIYLLKGMRGKAIQSESEALDMAIEALNFVSEHHQSNIETYAHDMGVSLEQAERELRVEELSCSEEPNRSDTIYRQDAIDAICEHGTDLERRGITVLAVANYKQATVDLLESLPSAQPEQGWIPVSERLPELKRNILFTTSQGFVAEGEYDGMFDGHHAWCQYRWSATLWDDEVIAWMPLPEPYKGETR